MLGAVVDHFPVPRIGSPVVAVLTSFDTGGHPDPVALGDYLDLLAAAGVTAILVGGTTGEFASLTVAERMRVLEHCRDRWRGLLVAQVGACAVPDATVLARHAQEHADMLAVMNPFFVADPPEDGIEDYFRAVLAVSDRPSWLYNFPRHTQAPITAALAARLVARFPHLVAIKDSGKDRALTRAYRRYCPGLRVFLGDDRAGADLASLGADGVVTGAGGPVAELPVAVAAALAAGDTTAARARQREFDRYTDLRKHLLPTSDIAFAKAAAAIRLPGFPTRVRPPLRPTGSDQDSAIAALMHALRPLLSPDTHLG